MHTSISRTALCFALAACGALSVVACGGDDETKTATGPGASLKCASGKNAWDTYGVNGFVAVNEKIFELTTAELTANGSTNLGTSLMDQSINFPEFKGNLAAFLVFAYGGPTSTKYTDGKTYRGDNQDMTEIHEGMNITSAQYDYFVANVVVPALTMNGVPMGDVTSCFAPPITSAAFKNSIINK